MKTKRLIAAITVSAGLILGPAELAQEETTVVQAAWGNGLSSNT
jgi:hypothetical protein